uniref:hypothetical protein n=1 Tax=Vibrio harveyi TaxID=669 RepID=UPI001E3A9E24
MIKLVTGKIYRDWKVVRLYKKGSGDQIYFAPNAKKAHSLEWASSNLKPGDVLLSHGEAPHYHR